MTCEGCSGAVERVLNRLKGQGVDSVDISLPEQKVSVTSTLSADQLLEYLVALNVGEMGEVGGEVALIADELSRAVELTLNAAVAHEARNQAYNACESFKESSPWCAQAGLLLASGQYSAVVKHFGLQLMEHTVKYRWTQITQAEKIFIKENAMKLLYIGGWETGHLNDALARVIVEMIKREWPQQWPTLLAELSDACAQGHVHTQIVLHVFLRLVEDVATLQTLEQHQRRKDIYQALTSNMSEIFAFFMRLIELHVVLLTLTGFVEWVSTNHVVMNNGRLLQILCVLLQDAAFQLPAADEDAISCIHRAAVASISAVDENNYLFLKKLSQQLTTLWNFATNVDFWMPVLLETMLLLTSHPSLTLAHTTSGVWLAMFRHDHISKLPQVVAIIPRWLQAAAPKVLKVTYPASRASGVHDAATYACIDYDSEQEFAVFFSRCRTEILDCFRHCMTAAPLVTWAYVEQWTRSALDKVDTCPVQLDVTHPLHVEWEALSQVLDVVLSRLLQAEPRPSVVEGLQLLQRCVGCAPAAPLLLSLLLSLISALFVFLSCAYSQLAANALASCPRVGEGLQLLQRCVGCAPAAPLLLSLLLSLISALFVFLSCAYSQLAANALASCPPRGEGLQLLQRCVGCAPAAPLLLSLLLSLISALFVFLSCAYSQLAGAQCSSLLPPRGEGLQLLQRCVGCAPAAPLLLSLLLSLISALFVFLSCAYSQLAANALASCPRVGEGLQLLQRCVGCAPAAPLLLSLLLSLISALFVFLSCAYSQLAGAQCSSLLPPGEGLQLLQRCVGCAPAAPLLLSLLLSLISALFVFLSCAYSQLAANALASCPPRGGGSAAAAALRGLRAGRAAAAVAAAVAHLGAVRVPELRVQPAGRCPPAPRVGEGLQLLQRCVGCAPAAPLLLSLLLSLISALFVFLSCAYSQLAGPSVGGAGAELLPRVLDKIFAALVYCGTGADARRSRAVKNVRRHAASLLVKLGSKYPLLLLPVFGRLHELCQAALARPGLSAVESVTIQEALLLVLGDCSARWAALGPHVSSAAALARLGLIHAAHARALTPPPAERRNLLGLCESDAPPPQPQDRMQTFLHTLHDNVCHLVGAAATTLGRELYSAPGLARALAGSLLHALPALPEHWLRPVVRHALKPLLLHCPPAHYQDVALPLLDVHAPFSKYTRHAAGSLLHALPALPEHWLRPVVRHALKPLLLHCPPAHYQDVALPLLDVHAPFSKYTRHAAGSLLHALPALPEHWLRPVVRHALKPLLLHCPPAHYQDVALPLLDVHAPFSEYTRHAAGSLLHALPALPEHWLRPVVRHALKPLLLHCPPAHYQDVALPLLDVHAPFMLVHLSQRWDYIVSLYESGKLEEEGSNESQEVLEDMLVRHLTREHLEVLKDSPPPVSTQRAPEHVSELGALVLARPHAGPAVLHTVRYSPPPSARSARPSTCPSWRARAGAAARRARRAAHGTVLAAPVSTQRAPEHVSELGALVLARPHAGPAVLHTRAPEHVSELGALVLARPHAGPAVLHTVRYSPPVSMQRAPEHVSELGALVLARPHAGPAVLHTVRYSPPRQHAARARARVRAGRARAGAARTPGPPCCTRYGTRRPRQHAARARARVRAGRARAGAAARRARRTAHGTVLAAPVSTQRAPEHVSELGALVLARPHAGPAVLHTVRYSPPRQHAARAEHVSELGALVLARPHAGPAVLHTVRYSPPPSARSARPSTCPSWAFD
ncbi:LOW QUALITY PROTEIN: hypothetical protein MSG28_001771 [Choristoneura fumiferana]|uniref:Uncharacterized protein n=2 Tax=Choristoneura fumiferana TaxID=7141 RepID=A0ACC0KVM7_CHOFU|nr:LOW QUALITY PROTEIN: hypothetical protein MSG28_001771 [Choristoneura fumiferana]